MKVPHHYRSKYSDATMLKAIELFKSNEVSLSQVAGLYGISKEKIKYAMKKLKDNSNNIEVTMMNKVQRLHLRCHISH